jgi:1-acyl-sn-glycerol-3-phosphate acyltransferase
MHKQVLGMFPEGTRSKGEGLKKAKTGAARLALGVHCAVIPLSINGTQNITKNIPQRTVVQITIGEPIFPEKDVSPKNLTDRIMYAIAEMLPIEARGVYQ